MTGYRATGGCLCGGVRFALTEPPALAGYCHCTRCQRRTGTSQSANVMADRGAFEVLEGEELVQGWRHPDGGFEKCFCRACGAHLFSRDPEGGPRLGIRLSAFDTPPDIPLTYRQFVDDAAPWEPVPDDGLERYGGSRFS